jgi:hypothetical protein
VSSVLLRCVVWQKFADVLEVLSASVIKASTIALTMKAGSTFYQTTPRSNTEDTRLHTRCCESLKSHPSLWLAFLTANIIIR